jgi:hypothetical protein
VSAVVTLQTGTRSPSPPGQDRNLDGLTNDRAGSDRRSPSSTTAVRANEVIEGWFNVAAFANPALGTNGSAGRSIVDGPAIATSISASTATSG